ncbi:MAG: protein kinase [Thermoflexales bacterium]|nr:protein kinase [Thermoflexales bacterium]
MIGQLLDGYEVQQEAGRGASAIVYVARQRPVERYVALKVFGPLDSRGRDRLRAVLAQLADLDHTNLLPVYASGTTGDQVYAVMRYMPTGTLQARLRAQRFRLDNIERIVSQVAAALDYAQQHGLAHGRLTPANILFDHAGNAFVADCGLTSAFDVPPSDYAAPELRRRPAPDLAGAICADAYSLGAILYELLTGKKPFEPDRDDERVNRRLALPPRPGALNSKVTPAIDAVVMKALALDPEQRYQSPLELAAALTQARAEAGAPPDGIRRVTAHPAARDRRGWVFGLIGLLIVIAAAIGLATRTPAAAPGPIEPAGPNTPTPPAVVPTTASAATPTTNPPVSPLPATAAGAAAPAITATPLPTVLATSSPTPAPTLTRTPSRTPRRVTVTPTPAISIDPLKLMIPRQSDRTTLILTFRTVVRPSDSGPLGLLSLQVPGIDPTLIEPILAQVGSGEQTLRVGVSVDCRRWLESFTTDQVIVTLTSESGRVLLSQTVQYFKTWCY